MRLRGRRRRRAGICSILALVLLCFFASLAVAFASATNMGLQRAHNLENASRAHAAAESGLAFLMYRLEQAELGTNLSGQALLDDLASYLQSELNGTANLGGNSVICNGVEIVIPSIAIGDNSSFTATLSMPDANTINLAITGVHAVGSGASLSRRLSMNFDTGARPGALDYGVYSKGPIQIGSNLNYRGVNSPDEASFYSEAGGVATAVGSNGYVDGSIDVMDVSASVSLGSNVTVVGDITIGVPPVPLPQVDGSALEAFATNVMDGSTPLSNATLDNLRIPANTNPQFTNNIILRGVIYVESPNYVYFKNNVQVIGVILTEDPAGGGGINKIEFKNNLDISGVEDLPNTPEFSALRQMTGSSILAPGFEVEFKNNFQITGGTLACESLILKNNVNATIKGAIIVYGASGLTFNNNAILTIDRSGLAGLPAGVTVATPTVLTPDPRTYLEP